MKTLAIWMLLVSSALGQQTIFTEVVAAVRRTYPGDTGKHIIVNSACGRWHDHIIAGNPKDPGRELHHYYTYLKARGIDLCSLQLSPALQAAMTQYGCPPGGWGTPYGGGTSPQPNPGIDLTPVPVPVPRPTEPKPNPGSECNPQGPPTVSEKDLRKIADILWERIKADPSTFKGDPGEKGDKGDPGDDAMWQAVVEFLDVNDDAVPSMTQVINAENPVITIPAAKLNIAAPEDPGRSAVVGAPLGMPIQLHQSLYKPDK